MPRRTPNIYPDTRKDGTTVYRVMLTFRDPDTGKRKQVMRTFRTSKEAKDALAENRAQQAKGTATPPSKMTVAELCQDWLAAHEIHLKPTSFEAYTSHVRRHIIPYLGHLNASQLTTLRIEQHYAALRAAGVGSVTISHVHHRLRQIMAYALRVKIVPTNHARDAKAPPSTRTQMQVYDDAQLNTFLRAAQECTYGPIFRVAAATGMRRGELLGLRWGDIDAEARVIHVRQQRAYYGGTVHTQSTKSGKARKIKVHQWVLNDLRRHRAQQLEWRLLAGAKWVDSDLVFTNRHGNSPRVNHLWRALQQIQDRAGLPHIRIHDLRHTHATWLLRHHRPLAEVSERLGHASTTMTLNVYAHALPDDHEATAELLGQLATSSEAQ